MKKLQSRALHFQKGVSKFGLLVLFILIASFLTVGLKIAPIYVDHNMITGICQELIDNGQAANMTITDVRQRVANSLRINSVAGFDLNDITMRKENNRAIITVAYERRLPLVGNLDVIAVFNSVLQ